MKDYYSILGLKRNATFYDITKAYRELAAEYDPESHKGDDLVLKRYNDIQEAYDILSNDLKRREYDSNQLPVEEEIKREKYLPKKPLNHTKEESAREEAVKVEPVKTDLTPTIEFFKSNKLEFNHEEDVTFRWKTENADKVTLLPFGNVSPTEQKTYKIKDFKSKYITFELIAENTSTGKKAVSSVTLKNNFYDELFNFFKNEIEKQYRHTAPLQNRQIIENQYPRNQRVPEIPFQPTPKKEYQPTIPEYQSRTTAKKSKPPTETGSSNIFQIIFKVFLYLFFLASLAALVYLGFFMS